jgi:hypothetical protein
VHAKTKIALNHSSGGDYLFLYGALAAAAGITLALPVTLLVSTCLFFGPPAIYLSWHRGRVARISTYALAIAVISIFTDYLAERDHSWVSGSMFSLRIAGAVPIEAVAWMFGFSYLIVAYYLYFYDRAPHPVIGKKMPLVFASAASVLIWVAAVSLFGAQLTVDYFYVKFGLLLLGLPLVAFNIRYPRYLKVFAEMFPYFFALGLINLITSLAQGFWAYPGNHFVGWVMLGPYRFPLEELVFWIILFPPFLVSQFELFNNDHFTWRTGRQK